MFENIMNLFKKRNKKSDKISVSSREAAKERLHLVLMQDRANVSADFLELMKQEIIEVIKKYIDVDEGAIDVRLTNKENTDGTNGAPALYANIPILNIKHETEKTDNKKKEEKQENNKKEDTENMNSNKKSESKDTEKKPKPKKEKVEKENKKEEKKSEKAEKAVNGEKTEKSEKIEKVEENKEKNDTENKEEISKNTNEKVTAEN